MLERRLCRRAASRSHRQALLLRSHLGAPVSCTPRGADTLHRQAAAPRCASVPLSRCASAPPLAGMRAELSLSLPPLTPQGRTWPVNATVTVTDCSGRSGAHVLAQLNISLWSGDAPADGGRGLLQQHRIPVRCRPCLYPQGRVYLSQHSLSNWATSSPPLSHPSKPSPVKPASP